MFIEYGKEPINDFTKLKEELHPFSNKKNQSQKLDNTTPQELYAEFAGKVLFYYYKCAQECPKQEIAVLPNSEPENRGTRQEQPFELPNNSSESEGLNVLKLLGKTKSFGDGNVIRAKNANITIKTEVPPELEDMEIVETNKGELAFEYSYTNVFSKILMKFNQLCCFKFTYNYLKKVKTRKWRLSRFTVNAKCMMDHCPVEAKIQQFYLDKSTLENKLTIYFGGDVYNKVGKLKSRRIIDNEKIKI